MSVAINAKWGVPPKGTGRRSRRKATTPPTTAFGGVLRSMRERRGWAQVDLGERSGLGASTISRLESGVRAPSPRTLVRLAQGLRANETERRILTDAMMWGDEP